MLADVRLWWYSSHMKHKKPLLIATGVVALVGSTVLAVEPFVPRQQERAALTSTEPIESEQTMPVQEEEPIEVEAVEAVNPAPQPASEPIVVVPQVATPISGEALFGVAMPMIQRANTNGNAYVTNDGIYDYIRRTYEANPAPFLPDALQSIVETCTDHLAGKYQELAGHAPIDFVRYRSTTTCPL